MYYCVLYYDVLHCIISYSSILFCIRPRSGTRRRGPRLPLYINNNNDNNNKDNDNDNSNDNDIENNRHLGLINPSH